MVLFFSKPGCEIACLNDNMPNGKLSSGQAIIAKNILESMGYDVWITAPY